MRYLRFCLFACLVLASVSCGPSVDLAKALTVTDVFSGWYDFGVVDGRNKLVPSITFHLKNESEVDLDRVRVMVSFWQTGDDGELDSKELLGIGPEGLAPGATSDAILVRSDVGYTLEQPRAELFSHSMFKDWIAKIFVRHAGKIVPLGEFTIDRIIIPQSGGTAGQ